MDGDQPSTSYGGGSPAADLSKVLGRDNPAGRALHLLYNKNAGKNTGNTFHQRNKEVHDKKLATGWTPSPVKAPSPPQVSKPEVSVPKFPKKIDYEMHAIDFVPRRRPMEVIRKELDVEYERMRGAPMPPNPRAVLDDAEKQRLADLMRFRGKVPQVSQEALAAVRRRAQPKSERAQLEEMFDSIMQEIEERRSFLQDLEGKRALKQEMLYQVRADIQQRVAELEKVDKMLKALDAAPASQ